MRLGKQGQHEVIAVLLGIWVLTQGGSGRWRHRKRFVEGVIEDTVKKLHRIQIAVLLPNDRRVGLAEYF